MTFLICHQFFFRRKRSASQMTKSLIELPKNRVRNLMNYCRMTRETNMWNIVNPRANHFSISILIFSMKMSNHSFQALIIWILITPTSILKFTPTNRCLKSADEYMINICYQLILWHIINTEWVESKTIQFLIYKPYLMVHTRCQNWTQSLQLQNLCFLTITSMINLMFVKCECKWRQEHSISNQNESNFSIIRTVISKAKQDL